MLNSPLWKAALTQMGEHLNILRMQISCIRQFSPSLLIHIRLNFKAISNLLSEAVNILCKMNKENKQKLPDDFTP